MTTRNLAILLATTLILAADHASGAQILFPKKADKVTFSLANKPPKCTSPNTTTETYLGGQQACGFNAGNPDVCLLSSSGSGTLQLKRVVVDDNPDVQVSLTLKGLQPNCEGKTLFPVFNFRVTVNDCNGSQTCTLPDFEGLSLADSSGGCVVNKGKCTSRTTLNRVASDLSSPHLLVIHDLVLVPLECEVRHAAVLSADPRIGCALWSQ